MSTKEHRPEGSSAASSGAGPATPPVPTVSDGPRTERRPYRAPHQGLKLGLKVAATLLVIGGGVGWALYSTADDAFQYYKHVDEIADQLDAWQGKPLELHGFVLPGTIQRRLDREQQQLEYKFTEINCDRQVEVRYAGVVPDTFKDAAEVVVKGKFTGNLFQATEILAKCPSKYQMQTGQTTMCARGAGN